MKIAIDARLFGTEFTGLGRYVQNLINQLADLDKKNEYFILLRKKYFNKLELAENFIKIKAEVPIYSLREQIQIPLILNELSPDITHFPHLNVPVFYEGKFVVTIHDIIMHRQGIDATTLPKPIYYLKRFPYKLVSEHAIKQAEQIIVPSNAVKKEVASFYKLKEAKINVTYEGVDTKVYSSKKRPQKNKEKYFVYVGNSYPHKNLNRLVEAIKYLNEELNINAQLKIRTSDNHFKNQLIEHIKQKKISEKVKFLPYLKDETLAELYANSIAFVFPSMSEGFGLPGLEAIQNKTLVLASDIPVFKEIYQNYVYYFNPESTQEMAEKMKMAAELSATNRNKQISKSQQLIKKYSWKKMAQQTWNIYNSVNSKM